MAQLGTSNFSGSNVDLDARGGNPTLDFIFQQFRNQSPKDNGLKIEGSAYFHEDFKKASIYSPDGLAGSLYVRYDGYSDEIQIKEHPSQENIQALLPRKDIHCVLNGTKLSFNDFTDKKGNYTEGYLFTRAEADDIILFERRRKLFKEGKKPKSSFELEVPNRFVDDKELYVGKQDGDQLEITYLKPSKKEVMKLFENNPEKASKVKKFVSDKGLKVKSAEDVAQIFIYYNTL